MYIPRPCPPSEGGDHILAVVTVALRDLLHLKPWPIQDDTGAIPLLFALYDKQGLWWAFFSPFLGSAQPNSHAKVILFGRP